MLLYDANFGIPYSNGAIDYTTDENRITSFSDRSDTMVDIFARYFTLQEQELMVVFLRELELVLLLLV